MKNVKQELLNELESINKTLEDVKAIKMNIIDPDSYKWSTALKVSKVTLDSLDVLNIDYDEGYGTQNIDGLVLFTDNTWLSRGEYDGSEWWEYNKAPTIEDILGD